MRMPVTPSPSGNEIIGWRTTLLPGQEDAYVRTHAAVPPPLAAALRQAGVVSWRIWRDGLTLFHVIETTDGRDAMGEAMSELGTIDAEWDALIATMLDAAEESSRLLPLVWGMDATSQFSDRQS
jgi:L-rhamnose mutarotase